MKAIQDELDASRHPQLVKNAEQVIPHDRLLAIGWSSRSVACASYFVTAVFASIAWWGLGRHSPLAWLAAGIAVLLVLVCAVLLGSLQPENRNSESRVLARGPRGMKKRVAGVD